MNKSTHKPIFEQKKPQYTPPQPKQPQKQEQSVPAAPSAANGGGRSANIITPAMIKKIELSILGQDNQVGPFSGYNSTVQSNTSLSSSRVYENPRENPMMQSFVKEVVQYEVNERYKILIERNQKLEEQLKESHKRIEQLETSFTQQDLQSQGNNTMDLSEIQSAIGNNQQIEELTQNYGSIKQNVEKLQKQFNEDVKQQVVSTLESIQQQDGKMAQILEQMNQKYENKLQLIEQQIKVFSTGTGTNEKVDGVDELTVKRLESEQLQVQSEIQQIKSLMEAHRKDQLSQFNSQIDDKIKNVNKEFDDLKKSMANLKQDLESKIDVLDNSFVGKSQDTSMRQSKVDYQKQIEQLQKSVQELSSQRPAPLHEIEKENKEIKEKFNKYQRETSSQIEELRRLILSNPQMMMEASKGAFRRQATYEDQYGGVYDGNNFQMFQEFKNRQASSEQDLVEIATFGSMNDSKVSNPGDYELEIFNNDVLGKLKRFRTQNMRDDDGDMQKSLTFGGKKQLQGIVEEDKQNKNQDEDWLKKYNEHQENVEVLLNQINTNPVGNINPPQPQKNNYFTNPPSNYTTSDDLAIKNKKYSHETPERPATDQGTFEKSSFDDMKINYDGIKSFLTDYQQQQQEEQQQPKTQNEEEPHQDLLQSEVSLASGTSHEQILSSLGYKEQIHQTNEQVDIKMIQSTTSVTQSQMRKSTDKPASVGEIEFEEGETMVYDKKSKKFNPLKPDGTPYQAQMSASQAIRQSTDMSKSKNNQLIEVNVHDLSFKDEENSQLYQSISGGHNVSQVMNKLPSLNERSSQNDLAYSIMITEPSKEDLIQEQLEYHSQKKLREEQEEQQKQQQKQEEEQKQEQINQQDIEALSPQGKSSSPHPAKADDSVEDDELPEDEEDELEESNKKPSQKIEEQKFEAEEKQEQDKSGNQFVIENRQEYVLSSIQSGNQEGESQQSDQQSQDFMAMQSQQEEEEEIVYQLDENGYLMDENGNYILGDDGEMVKLGEDDIQYLRQTNMLEED